MASTRSKLDEIVDSFSALQLPAPNGLPGEDQWESLKTVGVVTSRRVEGDRESIEIRYYLSSLAVDARLFARAVRGHWSVENACPNREGCSPQNVTFACLGAARYDRVDKAVSVNYAYTL